MSGKVKIDCDPIKIHPVLKKNFGFCLYKSAMRFRSMMDEALQKYGLLTPQIGMMRIIEQSGSLSQHDIGDCLGIDKTSIVKFIDQLEKLKLVTRKNHQTDRRIKMVSLTQKGTKVLKEVAIIRQQIEGQFLTPLTATERSQIKRLMPKLTRGTLSG